MFYVYVIRFDVIKNLKKIIIFFETKQVLVSICLIESPTSPVGVSEEDQDLPMDAACNAM